MMIDANELDGRAAPTPYDICVVGSGPAGLTVAHELRDRGLRICVLESGQVVKTEHADRLKRVRTEGEIVVADHSRERVVGGTSSTWDGLSAPLDSIDVEPRPWIASTGWPIDYAELCRYYTSAANRYGFPHPNLYAHEHIAALKADGDYHFAWSRLTERILLAPTRPQRFAALLRPFLASPDVDLYTDASVIELVGNPSRSAIEACEIRTRGDKALRIRASVFVLAAGGIENARLLLNSRDLGADGLGNDGGQVGRHFMNHPRNPQGTVLLDAELRHLPAYFGCLYRQRAAYLALRLDDHHQQSLGVLNSYVRLEPLYPWSDVEGVQLLINYIKSRRRLWERLQSYKGEFAALRDYSETGDDPGIKILGVVPSLPRLLAAMARRPRPVSRYIFHRVFDKAIRPRVSAVRIRNFMEMEPHPDNRVTLGPERDRYGKPLPLVKHSPTSLDRRSLVELHRALAHELRAAGLGTLVSGLAEADPWPINNDASHHMGATRMGRSPTVSVVNADCRLHDVPNVYVAGSSVFPTSGYANPTYTIVALAIRLAGHLGNVVTHRTGAIVSSAPALNGDGGARSSSSVLPSSTPTHA
jgi:choline dehydrogenase-like flavoprotein